MNSIFQSPACVIDPIATLFSTGLESANTNYADRVELMVPHGFMATWCIIIEFLSMTT